MIQCPSRQLYCWSWVSENLLLPLDCRATLAQVVNERIISASGIFDGRLRICISTGVIHRPTRAALPPRRNSRYNPESMLPRRESVVSVNFILCQVLHQINMTFFLSFLISFRMRRTISRSGIRYINKLYPE